MCWSRVRVEEVQTQVGRDARQVALIRHEMNFRRLAEHYFQLDRRINSEKNEGLRRRLMPWYNSTSQAFENARSVFIRLHDPDEQTNAAGYLERISVEIRNRVNRTAQLATAMIGNGTAGEAIEAAIAAAPPGSYHAERLREYWQLRQQAQREAMERQQQREQRQGQAQVQQPPEPRN